MTPNPSLYQVDTRDWLYRIGQRLGRVATLDDISDDDLRPLDGFDWIWLLGIWQTGVAGAEVSRSTAAWQQSFAEATPDLQRQDVAGSIFAICAYEVHTDFGGAPALHRLRQRLRKRDLRLMLDFVPNHTGIDHPWVTANPERFLRVDEATLERDPHNYLRLDSARGPMILAHGRDPNFSGWVDTLQLNYGNSDLQRAMIGELQHIATMCDGVRCDMAMLLLPEVYKRTWNIEIQPFWQSAIAAVRAVSKDFIFMAEVYWGLEWELQQLGFDYTYDKELYDRLLHGNACTVRGHLTASLDYQRRSVRFLENHDEARAAQVFDDGKHRAAAMITYFVPGLRFFHDGQLQGFRRKPSCHLRRRCAETADDRIAHFYATLLQLSRDDVFQGDWSLLDVEHTSDAKSILCFSWQKESVLALIAVNFALGLATGRAKIPSIPSQKSGLITQISSDRPARSATFESYLLLDLQPWEYVVYRRES